MTQKERRFIATVWQYYEQSGRHALPWRQTTDPYLIAVSEIMLQQTQVDRVIPKYEAFVKRWPTARALARASLAEVLIAWQGLGYNRRAKLLHQCAQTVAALPHQAFPTSYKGLLALPGIGPYTAGAISAFAYNQAVPILETNIKTVYIYHFFTNATDVSDSELRTLVAKTLDVENPRAWYWALMDYGSYLKRTYGNNISRSASYKKQSPFKGSDRQVRGAIVRLLAAGGVTRAKMLKQLTQSDPLVIDAQLGKLLAEQLIVKEKQTYRLPG